MLFEMTRSAQAGLRKERQHELISNHLANANTTGFKKDILSFDRALNPILTTDYSQGDLIETGNPLDLAIEGDGFFKVSTPSGNRYTRDGNFTVDAIGRMVTQEGFPVMGKNGPVTLSGDDIFFGDQGEVIMDYGHHDRPASAEKRGGKPLLTGPRKGNGNSCRNGTNPPGLP